MKPRPLDGITVIALEQAVAAPFASRQLADLGARVIKIERPGTGDFARGYDETVNGLSSHFVWLNRSKESLSLDLKHPAAIDIVHTLLAGADVFIQNLAPGAAARLGLGVDPLRARYPRLIGCSISGYGSTGPYRDRKAYDLLLQAEAGLMSITGTEGTHCRVGISIADIAGGMYAYSGILTALFARERTGEGSWLEVSLLEALGEWMSFPAYYAAHGGSAPPRSGARHAVIAPYGPFATRDQPIYLGIQNEREWSRFCSDVLGCPELAADHRFSSNPRRACNAVLLQELIEREFAPATRAEVAERLDAAGIAWANLNSVADFVHHPQLIARHRRQRIQSPAGALDALIPPVLIEGVAPRMDPIPAVGADTDAILRECGFSADAIRGLREERAV